MTVCYHEGKFPPKSLEWERIAPHLATATAELTRYDSFLGIIPDPDILLSPMLTAEAANSSRIEGTRATMSDVLAFEAGITNINPEKRDDIQEVINYRRAVILADEMLKKLPLTSRVLCAAHGLLLKGVRGELKSPVVIDSIKFGLGQTSTGMMPATCLPLQKTCPQQWLAGRAMPTATR